MNTNNFSNGKENKIFKKKVNNFFMDAYGNYPPGFNKKKRNINSARVEYQYNSGKINFLSPNVNYYLSNTINYNNNKKTEKKENTIIPNIHLNSQFQRNTNSQKNSNKNLKNINKTQNNNNNNLFITNIINSNNNYNSFNRKESKFIYIIFKLNF
jgi:hypothetical protein